MWEELGEPCVRGLAGGGAMDVVFGWHAVVSGVVGEACEGIGRSVEVLISQGMRCI